MFKIKRGLYGARLSPFAAIAAIFVVVAEVLGAKDLVYELSSALEGEHQPGSLHFVGLAYDFTIRSTVSIHDAHQLHEQIAENLGDDFDVLLNAQEQRFHIEFQPKRSYGKLGS